jgi:hypothetical protein
MEINVQQIDDGDNINLAGFPPIYKISNDAKKKREFNKSIETINKNVLNNLNILNVKNILNIKKS